VFTGLPRLIFAWEKQVNWKPKSRAMTKVCLNMAKDF
jgi:hypothetical protein